MSNSEQLVIFQLHIFILGISPMIWRRVKIGSDSTIADLHVIIQIAMGWRDSHLHRFFIHGKHYGIAQIEGMWFSDDQKKSSYQILAGECESVFYTNMISVITGSIKFGSKQFSLQNQIAFIQYVLMVNALALQKTVVERGSSWHKNRNTQ